MDCYLQRGKYLHPLPSGPRGQFSIIRVWLAFLGGPVSSLPIKLVLIRFSRLNFEVFSRATEELHQLEIVMLGAPGIVFVTKEFEGPGTLPWGGE